MGVVPICPYPPRRSRAGAIVFFSSSSTPAPTWTPPVSSQPHPPENPPFLWEHTQIRPHPKASIFVLTFRTFINTSFPSSFSVSNSPSTTLSCGYDPEYWKQWAADKTHFLSIKDPPQKGFLAPDHDLKPTCQGNSLMSACVPPTIRDPCFAIPQLRLSTPPVPDPPPLHPWPLPPPL